MFQLAPDEDLLEDPPEYDGGKSSKTKDPRHQWMMRCTSSFTPKALFQKGDNVMESSAEISEETPKEVDYSKDVVTPSMDCSLNLKEIEDVNINSQEQLVLNVVQAFIGKAAELKEIPLEEEEAEAEVVQPDVDPAQVKKKIEPLQRSSRIKLGGKTVQEVAEKITRKRNLSDLLSGLTKEDLVRGVEGLLKAVADADANNPQPQASSMLQCKRRKLLHRSRTPIAEVGRCHPFYVDDKPESL